MPASDDPEVFAVQQTMLEAWHVIAESFEDPAFGGRSWEVATLIAAPARLPDPTPSRSRPFSGYL